MTPADTGPDPDRDEYGTDYGDDPRIAGVEWERDHGDER